MDFEIFNISNICKSNSFRKNFKTFSFSRTNYCSFSVILPDAVNFYNFVTVQCELVYMVNLTCNEVLLLVYFIEIVVKSELIC